MVRKRKMILDQMADIVSAYRAIHSKRSPRRINISSALYKQLTGNNWKDVNHPDPMLFGCEVTVYDSEELEYSLTDDVFKIELQE